MLGSRYSVLDARCTMLDARFSLLGDSIVYMRFMMVKIRIRIMRVIRSQRGPLMAFRVKDSLTSLIFSTGIWVSV